MSVYADATVLIGLRRIDRLDLLTIYPTPILVMLTVWAEVAGPPHRPAAASIQRALADGLLAIVADGDRSAFPQLDAGEATVLSAAGTARAAVLVDERKARRCLNSDASLIEAIPWFSGIAGVLLLAKRRGRIESVRPWLDLLREETFRFGPALYDEILCRAGES